MTNKDVMCGIATGATIGILGTAFLLSSAYEDRYLLVPFSNAAKKEVQDNVVNKQNIVDHLAKSEREFVYTEADNFCKERYDGLQELRCKLSYTASWMVSDTPP